MQEMATTFPATATDPAVVTKTAEAAIASGEGRRALSKRRRVGTPKSVEETTAFQTIFEEMRAMKKKTTYRENKLAARIERQDEQFYQLREQSLQS